MKVCNHTSFSVRPHFYLKRQELFYRVKSNLMLQCVSISNKPHNELRDDHQMLWLLKAAIKVLLRVETT